MTITPEIAAEVYLVNLLDNNLIPSCRITEASARWFLLTNKSRIVNGNVRFYQMKHLGLGIYEVRLLPVGKKETVLVEVWKTVENNL